MLRSSELIEDHAELEGADATLSDGVLTIALGNKVHEIQCKSNT